MEAALDATVDLPDGVMDAAVDATSAIERAIFTAPITAFGEVQEKLAFVAEWLSRASGWPTGLEAALDAISADVSRAKAAERAA